MDRLTVIVDNRARAPMTAEHGLSICIETRGRRMLFDTGAGVCTDPVPVRTGAAGEIMEFTTPGRDDL